MKYEELQMLGQLVQALDDSEKKMEENFNKRDIENFNAAKASVLEFQKQIAQVLTGIK